MKDEIKKWRGWKKWCVTILLVMAGFLLCRTLYTLMDDIFNGVIVDWFEERYVNIQWISKPEGSEWDGYYSRKIDWPRLKGLIFWSFTMCTVLWILMARGIFLLRASKQKKQVIHSAGQMIRDYMGQTKEAAEIFPVDYAEISMQITEIKAAMQQNEQTLKAEAARKNDLITYLAHDLKTPLTSVIGYLSLLEEVPDMPPQQKAKYVHITLDKALRLERLINEFFEITRYNLQQIILEKETVDLAFLLVQLVDEFYPILSAHGNTVSLDVGSGTENSLTVYGDGEKLARVFNNILKNAVAYSYEGTQIRIWCSRQGDFVHICFQNQGKTIPAHKLDAIFEKFFRLDDARTTNTGGAGLGLAIAREIVNMHGGTITASSEKEVTLFEVTLPA